MVASSTQALRLRHAPLQRGGERQAYAGVDEIFTDHASVRLRTYVRKAHQLSWS
jgi:hypothetical protein